ncbi:hypothetical protein K501DRAFT_315533, partial [Backusella circina FSU 941]
VTNNDVVEVGWLERAFLNLPIRLDLTELSLKLVTSRSPQDLLNSPAASSCQNDHREMLKNYIGIWYWFWLILRATRMFCFA